MIKYNYSIFLLLNLRLIVTIGLIIGIFQLFIAINGEFMVINGVFIEDNGTFFKTTPPQPSPILRLRSVTGGSKGKPPL